MINISDVNILWPDITPPDIPGVRFTYAFCQQKSAELCRAIIPEHAWIRYSEEETLEHVLARTSASRLLIVTDPEIILCSICVTHLCHALEADHVACGPMYNETPYPEQRVSIPYRYYNVSTFLEVTNLFSEQLPASACRPVQQLDPACFLCWSEHLDKSFRNIPVQKISEHLTGQQTITCGAFVHRFKNYYNAEREDLIQLVPESVTSVLDVGCALGGYGKRLKQMSADITLTGVEQNPLMAAVAAQYYDTMYTCPIEEIEVSCRYDVINCGDILEHLKDPWNILKHFYTMLKKGGYLITSVPNVGHWSLVRNLIQGLFQYIPFGLTCVSHIRWFTEKSIREALEEAGFVVEISQREQAAPTPQGEQFIKAICDTGYGNRESLLTHEFIIRAVKP